MQKASIFALLITLLTFAACSGNSPSPDQIRQQTADATAKLRTGAKAAAEGVREGWKRGHLVDLNSASADDLAALPGMTHGQAEKIIAARPYASTHELVSRRILTQAQFDTLRDQIEVKPH